MQVAGRPLHIPYKSIPGKGTCRQCEGQVRQCQKKALPQQHPVKLLLLHPYGFQHGQFFLSGGKAADQRIDQIKNAEQYDEQGKAVDLRLVASDIAGILQDLFPQREEGEVVISGDQLF